MDSPDVTSDFSLLLTPRQVHLTTFGILICLLPHSYSRNIWLSEEFIFHARAWRFSLKNLLVTSGRRKNWLFSHHLFPAMNLALLLPEYRPIKMHSPSGN